MPSARSIENTPDPLCTVGDGHQRIYRAKIPLEPGRHRHSGPVSPSQDQLSYERADSEICAGDSRRGGDRRSGWWRRIDCWRPLGLSTVPEPSIEKCKSERAEAETIVAWVQMLREERGLETYEICVTPYKPAIRTALTAANIATYELKPREEDPGASEAGVRMGAMKRIKGLEFRAVALACAAPTDPMNHIGDSAI